jgi:hypothetical protein
VAGNGRATSPSWRGFACAVIRLSTTIWYSAGGLRLALKRRRRERLDRCMFWRSWRMSALRAALKTIIEKRRGVSIGVGLSASVTIGAVKRSLKRYVGDVSMVTVVGVVTNDVVMIIVCRTCHTCSAIVTLTWLSFIYR